jgi:trimethylamine---corrinoid protein Co-methyltransferase
MPRAKLTVWDAEACGRVHTATLAVLAGTGVEVRHDPSLKMFRTLGARVEGTRVRLSSQLVEDALASAPRTWAVRSRGAHASLDLRDGPSYFGTGSDCLYTLDPSSGERRRVRLSDVTSMAALSEKLRGVDFVMSMGLPEDVPTGVDDVAPVAAMMAGTRKPLMVAPRDGSVLPAMQEMAAACGAADSLMIYAMPSPPLMHDRDALTKVVACARLGIPLVYAPAPSCGATAPMSVTGGAVLANAEVLSGLVLHQHVQAGAPFVYGAGLGALDMHTALEAYVVPESYLGLQVMCDLAHFYGLPSFSYAAVSDSKCLDEQWSLEAGVTAVLGALSAATLLHDVGYLESGLLSSHESIVLGEEMVGYARAFMRDVAVDDESLCVAEIDAVGPGGDFLRRRHTRAHLRDFWQATLLDHNVHERWQAGGATTLGGRVKEKTRLLLAEEPAFRLDDDAFRELERIVVAAGAARA